MISYFATFKGMEKGQACERVAHFFAKRYPNLNGPVSEHEIHHDEKDYDVIAAIEQENLSCLHTAASQSANNGTHNHFSNPDIHHFTEDESLQDAVEYLKNGAPSDDAFVSDSWSGIFNPLVIFGVLTFLALGFLGYYFFFMKQASEVS